MVWNCTLNGLKQCKRGDMVQKQSDWSVHSQTRNRFRWPNTRSNWHMRWGISSMMKCSLKEQHCNSPKEKIPHFIWKYFKHSIIIVAVAHFEKNKVARYSYLTRKIHCMASNHQEKVFWKMGKNMLQVGSKQWGSWR